MKARQMASKITLAGKDVTQDLSPYLRGITYTDKVSGEADTLEIELIDKQRLFMGDWFPPRGSTLSVELSRINFMGDGRTERLDLGEFEIDEVANSYAPSVCKIKAVSISQNNYLRQHDISKSWENVKLSAIAQEIATAAGVKLVYNASDDPQLARAEQGEESTLAFLEKICADNGLALKVTDETLVIFDETELEEQEPVMTIDSDSIILHFDARATLNEIYKSCEVNYKHGKHAEQYSAKFEAPGKESGKTLKINQRVESQADAEKLARKKLREKNKEEIKISLTTVGNFALLSGNCIELIEHGFYNGKFIIESATHTIGDGYQTRVEIRKCLEGY